MKNEQITKLKGKAAKERPEKTVTSSKKVESKPISTSVKKPFVSAQALLEAQYPTPAKNNFNLNDYGSFGGAKSNKENVSNKPLTNTLVGAGVVVDNDGKPTGKYYVGKGQGPTQMAEMINDYAIMNGYEPVSWKDIVLWNKDVFINSGNWSSKEELNDIHSSVYKDLNINHGDLLKIRLNSPRVQVLIPIIENGKPSVSFSSVIASLDVAAGIGPLAAGAGVMGFDVPDDGMFWESGLNINIYSAGVGAGVSFGVGADGSIQMGKINFNDIKGNSIKDILDKAESVTVSGQFVSPIGIGGKFTRVNTKKGEYTINMGGPVFGTPGGGASVSPSAAGIGKVKIKGLETYQDSIRQASKSKNKDIKAWLKKQVASGKITLIKD